MCGRVKQVLDWQEMKIKWWKPSAGGPLVDSLPHDEIGEGHDDGRALPSRPKIPLAWNGSPGQHLIIIRPHHDRSGAEIEPMFWGFIPAWEKDPKGGLRPINAKAENIDSRMWRDAFRQCRGLLPVRGFYEWQRTPTGKQPYAIDRADNRVMYLGAIWNRWIQPVTGEEITSFAVITCAPSAVVAPIHNRMPVMIAEEDIETWLYGPAEFARRLLLPAPDKELVAYPVSSRVNSPRNNDPDVAQPLAP